MTEALAAIGFEVLPSSANFVFARHPSHGGTDLATALRAKGVLVRHFATPRTADYVRITVGTRNETDGLLRAVKHCL